MKITIPIRGSDYEEDYDYYEIFLKEIVELTNNPSLVKLLDDQDLPEKNERPLIEKITFEVIEDNLDDNSSLTLARELGIKHSFFSTQWITEYLIIEIEFKQHKAINEIEQDGYALFMVNDYITRLNFLLNLSYSTNIDFLPGVLYSNDGTYLGKTEMITAENMMYVYEHARRMGWPKIKSISLTQTLNWYNNNNIHTLDQSKNPLHRAINAFSQLLGDLSSNNSSNLFWIMLGIEALLVEGNQNITTQFKEKSILILGQPKEYSKKLTKLYDYRSKLVHGSSEIFPKFRVDYEAHHKEYDDYLSFATSILIALIRELIYKTRTSFEFELRLKD